MADESCVVKEVHEFFGDYVPIGTDHYTLNLIDGVQLCRQPSNWKAAENNMFHRATDVCIIVYSMVVCAKLYESKLFL